MGKQLVLLLALLIALPVQASSDALVEMHSATIYVKDKARLQRGASLFMNYCSGCHSLKYLRYNRMAKDLGLTTFAGEVDSDLLYNNLIFTSARQHDPIRIAMPPEDARQWFGVVPPDLTLTARQRGPQWIYTYLKSFYADSSRPFGANNLLIPGVAMPNVLASLQGQVIPISEDESHPGRISHLLLTQAGSMDQHQFDSALEDLVNFLVYAAEPAQLVRYRMGFWVLIYLFILLGVSWQLKKAYWRKIKH